MEMVTRIKDLAEKLLKEKTTRDQVVDVVVKEQFINVLLEEAKVGERAQARNFREGRQPGRGLQGGQEEGTVGAYKELQV